MHSEIASVKTKLVTLGYTRLLYTNYLSPASWRYNNDVFFIADSWSISQTQSQAQEHKKWVAMHQRTLQKRCLHTTNIERSKALYPHHSCIVIRKSTKNGYPYSSAHHITGVSTQRITMFLFRIYKCCFCFVFSAILQIVLRRTKPLKKF